ncbi:hypothetical protein H6G33_29430 [Calothrix sp. FACHB-1219]|nr:MULTISPECIES: hypothetical protein [unclassified Calothrix]MBD2206319.1 hypothetical protein [Calothrix sp. FACHB-168]MBD2221101.1 hypothetical protein [Calothrix sp. FACHB-1219]
MTWTLKKLVVEVHTDEIRREEQKTYLSVRFAQAVNQKNLNAIAQSMMY